MLSSGPSIPPLHAKLRALHTEHSTGSSVSAIASEERVRTIPQTSLFDPPFLGPNSIFVRAELRKLGSEGFIYQNEMNRIVKDDREIRPLNTFGHTDGKNNIDEFDQAASCPNINMSLDCQRQNVLQVEPESLDLKLDLFGRETMLAEGRLLLLRPTESNVEVVLEATLTRLEIRWKSVRNQVKLVDAKVNMLWNKFVSAGTGHVHRSAVDLSRELNEPERTDVSEMLFWRQNNASLQALSSVSEHSKGPKESTEVKSLTGEAIRGDCVCTHQEHLQRHTKRFDAVTKLSKPRNDRLELHKYMPGHAIAMQAAVPHVDSGREESTLVLHLHPCVPIWAVLIVMLGTWVSLIRWRY